MNAALTSLEAKALEVALSGVAPWLEQLRQQVSRLRVVSRKYTGFGFYTDFACEHCIAATELPAPGSPENVPVAWASHPEVEAGGHGAIAFNVFLRNGIIVCLEGASTSAWPDNEELITFSS